MASTRSCSSPLSSQWLSPIIRAYTWLVSTLALVSPFAAGPTSEEVFAATSIIFPHTFYPGATYVFMQPIAAVDHADKCSSSISELYSGAHDNILAMNDIGVPSTVNSFSVFRRSGPS